MLPAKGFLTLGINTAILWPSQEKVIDFRGQRLHLLPATDKLQRMIRAETTRNFTRKDADRLILEFLSALAWAEQRGIVPTFGTWCTAPLDIGKEPADATGDGHFDYLPNPPDPKAMRALVLYREGLSVNLVPYKVLGFFKVINTIRDSGADQKQWIRDNLQYVTDRKAIARIASIQNVEPDVANYLYVSGRCAVAHAFNRMS